MVIQYLKHVKPLYILLGILHEYLLKKNLGNQKRYLEIYPPKLLIKSFQLVILLQKKNACTVSFFFLKTCSNLFFFMLIIIIHKYNS